MSFSLTVNDPEVTAAKPPPERRRTKHVAVPTCSAIDSKAPLVKFSPSVDGACLHKDIDSQRVEVIKAEAAEKSGDGEGRLIDTGKFFQGLADCKSGRI